MIDQLRKLIFYMQDVVQRALKDSLVKYSLSDLDI